jgi:hypothetical protein
LELSERGLFAAMEHVFSRAQLAVVMGVWEAQKMLRPVGRTRRWFSAEIMSEDEVECWRKVEGQVVCLGAPMTFHRDRNCATSGMTGRMGPKGVLVVFELWSGSCRRLVGRGVGVLWG